jgi:ribonuclease HII
MEKSDFDQLLAEYRAAVDRLVDEVHKEESLANEDHSLVEMERWDDEEFKVEDAAKVAKKARDRYIDALRQKNYGF